MKGVKKLTTKDVVLGIGRAFTNSELLEYLERTKGGEPKSATKMKRNLKRRLLERLK